MSGLIDSQPIKSRGFGLVCRTLHYAIQLLNLSLKLRHYCLCSEICRVVEIRIKILTQNIGLCFILKRPCNTFRWSPCIDRYNYPPLIILLILSERVGCRGTYWAILQAKMPKTQYTWTWVSPLRSRHSQDIFSWNGRRPHISQDENAWQYNSPHGLNLFYNCFICFNVKTK